MQYVLTSGQYLCTFTCLILNFECTKAVTLHWLKVGDRRYGQGYATEVTHLRLNQPPIFSNDLHAWYMCWDLELTQLWSLVIKNTERHNYIVRTYTALQGNTQQVVNHFSCTECMVISQPILVSNNMSTGFMKILVPVGLNDDPPIFFANAQYQI